MSSDTIFAAQFWLWPDPAMKRDSQGRIIFINAAFLQLYGGSVEAWTGNVLQGWPAPQAPQPGAYPPAYRFETRMPAPDPSMLEQVFDWMEQTSPDGTAFAIARNVTDILPSHMPDYNAHYSPESAPQTEQPQAQQNIAADIASAIHQDTMANFDDPAPAVPSAPPITEATFVQNEVPEYEAVQAAPVPEPAQEFSAQPQPAPQAQTVHQPVPAQPTVSNASEAREPEVRDFERRALPLESNSAILGNNWRDAVIAKAVGAGPEAAVPVEATPAPAPEPEAEIGNSKHILLAEDNAINALLTRTLLEAEGHTVETVEDGALAVEAMKTQSFDLIFMDMRMPNMDGLESTRKIRQLPNVPRSLPIIALTANAFDDDRNACFDSGMNDFMTKPVSAEELTEMVINWTDPEKMKIAS